MKLGLFLGVAAAAVMGSVVPMTYDRYISTTGSDANDGLTAETAWASCANLVTLAQAAANDEEITCRVLTGTYTDKGPGAMGASINSGVSVTIYMDDGVVWQGPAGVDRSWVDVNSGPWTLEVRPTVMPLPGVQTWTIQGYDTGTGNGLGMDSASSATLIARHVLSTGNVDGISCHGTNPQCYVYDSVFKSCSKSAASHVSTGGLFHAYRSEFWGNPGGSTLGIYMETVDAASTNTYMEECKFIPTGTVSTESNCDFRNATLVRCQIGITTAKCLLVGSNGTTSITDSYMNASWDQNRAVNLLRCYGRASIRMRNTALTSTVDHCVFVDSPTGASVDAFLWANFDPTSMGNLQLKNSVIRGFSAPAAIGSSFTAGYGTYWANSGSVITSCVLFGNTLNIDADIVSADPGSITGTVTSDPLLGSMTGYLQTDYGYTTGSPCIGAGEGGSNIGFPA